MPLGLLWQEILVILFVSSILFIAVGAYINTKRKSKTGRFVKDPCQLYAHLLALGIDVQQFSDEHGDGRIGFIQVAGKNIAGVDVVEKYDPGGIPTESGPTRSVHLEYRVRLGDIPCILSSSTKLKKRSRFPLLGQITDIRWKGGVLADRLNGDLSLTESLLAELHENRDLAIRIVFDPNFGCAKIVTEGVEKHRFMRRPLIGLPSRRLFDCLDRIAEDWRLGGCHRKL